MQVCRTVNEPPPTSMRRSSQSGDKVRGRALMLELFRRGIFLNPMGTKLYLSLEHDEQICDLFCERLDAALVATG